jgi:hypothetical protein
MREKLIELVNDVLNYLPWGEISPRTGQEIADHLIANGVTFATDNNVGGWIPVTERLPDNGVFVLVSDGRDYPEIAELVLMDSGQLIWLDGNFREVKHITHWRPLPEPPKGE